MKLVAKLTATIGMMVAVTAALALLKLAGWQPVASWDWWLVTGPLWGPWALLAGAALVLLFSLAVDRGMRKLENWARV